MPSVVRPWLEKLPLRMQAAALVGLRGCDFSEKYEANGELRVGPEKQMTAWIRWCLLVPADDREVDIPGAFMRSVAPMNFKLSMVAQFPMHWVSHMIQTVQIIAYHHPGVDTASDALHLYLTMVSDLHLKPERSEQQWARYYEDRIASGKVVS